MHGYEIHLEKATLQFDFQAYADSPESMPIKLLTENGQVVRPDLGDGDPVLAFGREIQEAITCFSENRPSEILNGSLARDAIEICQMQSQSVKENRFVEAS